jgi:ketosteroid isomerase-like protein
MSQENVETFKRGLDAYNRRDIDGFLATFDPAAEWRPLNQVMFGAEATVYRGYEGVRKFVREVDDAFAEAQLEYEESRDLGERIVVIGHVRTLGRASGAQTESPIAWLVEFRNGKVTLMKDYLDPREALEAAGLSQ